MYRKSSRGISAYIGYIAIDVISCELAFLFAFILRQGGTPVTLVIRVNKPVSIIFRGRS